MPKISAKHKRVTPTEGSKCRWGRLSADAVAEKWWLPIRSIVSLARSQVYQFIQFITLSVHVIRLQRGIVKRPLIAYFLGWPWTILDLIHRILVSNILNMERDNVGHNGGQIWNHLWACDWHYEHWPWMTLNCPSSRSLRLHIKYFENGDRYDDDVNGSRIWKHTWAIDWHVWPTCRSRFRFGLANRLQL